MASRSSAQGQRSFRQGRGSRPVRGLSPFGSAGTMFGDGSYSGNIIQGGVVLQPQDYIQLGANVLPVMSSATTGTVTVSASSQYNAAYAPWYCCDRTDGSNTNMWISSTGGVPGWWQVRDTAPKVIGGYSLRSVYQLDDNPVAWTVKGSNTGAFAGEETLLDTRSGQTFGIFETKTYSFGALWSFQYIRFNFTQTYAPGNYIQLNEVELLAGTAVPNCIVITGSATVAPDAVTDAAVVMGDKFIVDGPTASLKPSTKCKGLLIFYKTSFELRNGAKLNADRLGKAGNFGTTSVYDLVPSSLKRKLKRSFISAYSLQGEGALGASPVTGNNNGTTGAAATAMQTGGGGSGGVSAPGTLGINGGGKGGPFCGGAGGGAQNGTPSTATAGGPYGGPGGDAFTTGGYLMGGGAGDPVGAGMNGGTPAPGPGGGVVMTFGPDLTIGAGCVESADGSPAGSGNAVASGSSGGGAVVNVTLAGGLHNAGTIRAAGGPAIAGTYQAGGGGGLGSINNYEIAA